MFCYDDRKMFSTRGRYQEEVLCVESLLVPYIQYIFVGFLILFNQMNIILIESCSSSFRKHFNKLFYRLKKKKNKKKKGSAFRGQKVPITVLWAHASDHSLVTVSCPLICVAPKKLVIRAFFFLLSA